MWNQEDALDAGRFLLHQAGWDNKSALERYNTVHDPDFRVGPYGGRSFAETGFPRENGYARGGFHRDLLFEGESFQMAPPVLGMWPPARRTTLEEELAIIRGQHRHGKVGFLDGYREIDSYRDVDYREIDGFRDINSFREIGKFRDVDNFREVERFRDYGFDRVGRFVNQDKDNFDGDDYAYRRAGLRGGSREGSWEREYTHSRYEEYGSDHEKEKKDRDKRKKRKKDKEKRRSKDRDESPERGRRRERSRSHGHDHRSRRSRSRSRSHARDRREGSHEDDRYDSRDEKKSGRDDKRHRERTSVAPSATLVVKGLSQKTVDDDLYHALVEWGPLRHVRVIKERNTGISRGFAFVDFPSVDAAKKMMDGIGENGLVVDGRRLFFEYSSKPTGGLGGPQALPTDSAPGSAPGASKGGAAAASAVDWMCTVCGCVNFARRTSCFQCNEGRTDDAPSADVTASTPASTGKKGSEAGPTHVLVVRGLDENVNEEILHYEFSKYAPIKDLRLVRDKFTHISRGFAFIHFHSVEEATKALESSNGTSIEKNGQPLRVAYAKSIHGPSSSSTNASSSLAAAAIEAATFAQQYDSAGWAPKEYNPEQEKARGTVTEANAAPQAGFVWDEASGYYYDAVSGFYYDGHRGLYYDGNNGIWYSYNQETQQYETYVEQSGDARTTLSATDVSGDVLNQNVSVTKANDGKTKRKAVISAPPATIHVEQDAVEKKLSVAEAVEAAAAAAQAASKKEREKMKEKEKELRQATKNLLLGGKKKIGGVLSLWKQRHNEGQVTSVDQGSTPTLSILEDKPKAALAKSTVVTGTVAVAPAVKKLQGVIHTRQGSGRGGLLDETLPVGSSLDTKYKVGTKSATVSGNGSGITLPAKKLEGVIHTKEGSTRLVQALGRVVENPFGGDYHPSESTMRARPVSSSAVPIGGGGATGEGAGRASEPGSALGALSKSIPPGATPFKTDASALGSYGPMAGGKRRFTEAPQPIYRDRAAERRSLYGASLSSDV